ncbi:MAG: rhomboid family intramembrane serine protease [Anaerolineae bacterium]|nr:rhomboid family intramembrane serine protease [Anaerolineae bacterium]
MNSDSTKPASDTPVPLSDTLAPPSVRLALPQSRPVAAWIIFGLNILVWLAMVGFSAWVVMAEMSAQGIRQLDQWLFWALNLSSSGEVLVLFGAKFDPLIVDGQVWRLITPIFLHVGFVHLLFNSYAIYAIAPQIERVFGVARFVCIYMLSGAFGVLLSFAFSPNLSAGASGAIFGLIGTQAAFFYRYRRALGGQGQRLFQNTLSVIVFNLVMTFTVSGIDIWGHVGGLLSGVALGWWMMPRYAPIIDQDGPRLADQRTVHQWGGAVLVGCAVFVASAWLAIVIKSSLMST